MKLYAKVIDEVSGLCDVGLGSDSNFYVDKGMSLIEVEQCWDGKWYKAGYAPEKPIDLLKKEKLNEIKSAYEDVISSVIPSTSTNEMYILNKKESEARTWMTDNSVDTPLIDSIAETLSVDKSELVKDIIVKVETTYKIMGKFTGLRQKYESQLEAAETAEDIAAITPLYKVEE